MISFVVVLIGMIVSFVDAALPLCDGSLSQDFYTNTMPVEVLFTSQPNCPSGSDVDLIDDFANVWTIRGDDSSSLGINLCEAWSNSSKGTDPYDNGLVSSIFIFDHSA